MKTRLVLPVCIGSHSFCVHPAPPLPPSAAERPVRGRRRFRTSGGGSTERHKADARETRGTLPKLRQREATLAKPRQAEHLSTGHVNDMPHVNIISGSATNNRTTHGSIWIAVFARPLCAFRADIPLPGPPGLTPIFTGSGFRTAHLKWPHGNWPLCARLVLGLRR